LVLKIPYSKNDLLIILVIKQAQFMRIVRRLSFVRIQCFSSNDLFSRIKEKVNQTYHEAL